MEAVDAARGRAARDAPGSPSLTQTLDIETPELVSFSYTIAGIGSRVSAALIDYFICFVLFVLLLIALAAVGAAGLFRSGGESASTAWAMAVLALGQFFIIWGYYVLFEGLADGQTPGKRWLKLRVVSDGGYSVTFAASAARNLIRVVDMQPVITYFVGMTSIVATRSGKRLGDLVAGTIVVRERLVETPGTIGRSTNVAAGSPELTSTGAASPRVARLTDDEFAVLERFIGRRSSLEPARRQQLAEQLASQLASHLAAPGDAVSSGSDAVLGMRGADDQSAAGRLLELYADERAARAAGAVVERETGAARERHAIIASGSPRWASFAARLAQAQRRGLRSLGEEGVREFVAEYRDLAADLARLQTATRGREREEIFYLSRLMSGAHNLLYRSTATSLRDVIRVIAIDAPREVRRSIRPILIAATIFFAPMAIAYTAVVREPATARVFLPRAMLDRAEDGVQRAREGRGYITDPQLFRPVMASTIIANNVQVTFAAFALGATLGLGTVFILLMNGVSIGGVFGLYASKGIGRLLLAFVAPHGVLELTAICIAGGAGLLIAAAVLIPGPRTRRRALVENGRRALLLIAASTVMLLVAGTIEGFISPIETWPLSWKLAVSGTTVVLMVWYLAGGRRKSAVPAAETTPTEVDVVELGLRT